MHLLTSYALTTASKVSSPYVYTSYFPVPAEKYVTFQAQSKFDSKNYSYWQDVLNIIFPVLGKHGIMIAQVGQANETAYQYVIDLRGKTNISQLSYVIKNSLLHFGPDSLGVHISSSFDVPIVGLYSCSPSSISGPYFGDKNKQILFDAYKNVKNGKPSYAAEESPKSINTIKPEEIANAIFKLLGIDFKCPFETVYTGDKYSSQITRELVPNTNLNLGNPNVILEVRMDLHFDEKILAQQLALGKCAIVTNKPISIELLKQYKPNIAALVYVIEEDDDPDFINKRVKSLGIPMLLISYLPREKVEPKKINYYETGRINIIDPPSKEVVDKLKADLPNLYFKSNKITASRGMFFMTNTARANAQEVKSDFDYYKVIDCPEMWSSDLNFMHIIKKT